VFPAVFALLFASCISDDGENSTTYYGHPLIVSEESGLYPVVLSQFAYSPKFYAPALEGKVSPGDCLLANFTINFDEQSASDKYYIITDMVYDILDKIVPTPVTMPTDTLSEEYPDIIYDLILRNDEDKNLVLIDRTAFIILTQRADQGNKFSYRMVWVENEDETVNPVLHLSLKAEGEKVPSDEGLVIQAVDLRNFLNRLIASSPQTSSFNIDIRYYAGIDDNGVAIYKTSSFQVPVSK
jgi:hypothetical protein